VKTTKLARRDELLARGYKHCTKCDKTRPVAEFSKNRRRRDGLSYMCRWCSSEYAAHYYEQNREEERAVCERAYRVGAALAWLVQRMETFCGATDGDVLIYKRGDRSRIPERIPRRRCSMHRHGTTASTGTCIPTSTKPSWKQPMSLHPRGNWVPV
jgi:hypothetical protein